jgi:hypothetical protein
MKIASNELAQKSRQQPPKLGRQTNTEGPFQVIEILSTLQPRRASSSLCSPWGPWWLFHEGKQSRNEDCYQQQVGPKIKTTTAKVRTANQHSPFQVIEILSIIQPRRAQSSLCSPWGLWWLFHEGKQSI